LAAAAAYAALCMPRPWRAACSVEEARRLLAAEVAAGRLCAVAANAVAEAADGIGVETAPPAPRRKLLSDRETAVLRRLSLGESNKEVARELQISPSTVRTHVESIFRKLGCTTRTAATLKGLTLGFI
jgi:DNA-binding NarL/FixJ family response regulator